MLAIVLPWLLKVKSAKAASAATVGGGTILTLVLALHSGVTEKLDAQQKEINQIKIKAAPIDATLKGLKHSIDNNNIMVRDIYKHLLNRSPRLKPLTEEKNGK